MTTSPMATFTADRCFEGYEVIDSLERDRARDARSGSSVISRGYSWLQRNLEPPRVEFISNSRLPDIRLGRSRGGGGGRGKNALDEFSIRCSIRVIRSQTSQTFLLQRGYHLSSHSPQPQFGVSLAPRIRDPSAASRWRSTRRPASRLK